ncbi:hypothetical protein JANAI62_10790 [Jannaschia pagri]|uniref:YjiS-like domain-containing protein n=1 Tax=Jannaschia pagri TaxID=2829797 RepID=A0ABQ4NJE3_9RHOB|nr:MULTISPECIES: DUF1127 domain-containing protein [unclassified Jannaschia]GIT90624.1 hypothetical protein JANAI61_10820 [Jannaschia sp. AI_61]GIT94456.1 hypothetical protein JANAI62_10790 [Jannaschia sp. AI_62]
MAYTTYGNSAATSTLRARVAARLDAIRQDWSKWRLYRKTYNELSALSNRDLADLGLSRAMIASVAFEAAYGA